MLGRGPRMVPPPYAVCQDLRLVLRRSSTYFSGGAQGCPSASSILAAWTGPMLALGLLLATVLPAVVAFGGHQRSTPLMAPAGRTPVTLSCTDIEDLPAGLVEDYKRHQAATYHAFTTDKV